MSIDDRLRSAASELNVIVAGRRRPDLGGIRRRRSQLAVSAALAAVVVTTLVVATIPGEMNDAATDQTPAASTTPTSAPDITTTSTIDDGFADLDQYPPNWLATRRPGVEVLLLEDGLRWLAIEIPNPDGTPLSHLTTESWTQEFSAELGTSRPEQGWPELVVGFSFDPTRTPITVYGMAPTGTESIRLEWANGERLEIERIFDRPSVDRVVFLAHMTLESLVDAAPTQLDVTLTSADGSTTRYEAITLQAAHSLESYRGPLTFDLFPRTP